MLRPSITENGKLDQNKPRYLTTQEIKSIVNKIGYFAYTAATKDSSIFARQTLINFETFRMRNVILTPLALEKYTELYINNNYFSRSEYGTPVGATAGEATSQSSSQQALNSFKVEVSRATTNSVEVFEEILEVRKRKSPKMFVYFKDNPTIETIVDKKRLKFETITVDDLATYKRIESVENVYPNKIYPSWYKLYELTITQFVEMPIFSWMLQLRISTDLMYKNKIMPRDISRAIEKEGILSTIYSPLIKDETGTYILMDIYVQNVGKILKIKNLKDLPLPEENKIFMYLNNIVKPSLSSIIVKGLNNITRIQRYNTLVNFSLYLEINLNRYFPNKIDEYIIKLNVPYMTINFITIQEIINLFNSIGVTDIKMTNTIPELSEYTDMELYVKLKPKPDNLPLDKYSPILYLNHMLTKDNEDTENYRRSQRNIKDKLFEKIIDEQNKVEKMKLLHDIANIKIYREPTVLNKCNNQIYIETEGQDFSELIKMDDIDMTRSYTNDLNDILRYFGIEAVRAHIIKELIVLIKSSGSDSYVDPRHMSIIADWMTMFGFITPFTLKGMKYHKLGPLANAALREPTKALQEDAMMNKIDYLNNVSSAITVGKPIKLGTGVVDLIVDQEKIKKQLQDKPKQQKQKINLDVTSKIVSILLEGDYLDPTDTTKENTLENINKNGNLPFDIPISFNTDNIIFSNDTNIENYSINTLFPLISPELKTVYENSIICNPQNVNEVVVETDIPIESPVNRIVNISTNIKVSEDISIKPPEVETLDVENSFLDNLIFG